jgi:hypothetical protein
MLIIDPIPDSSPAAPVCASGSIGSGEENVQEILAVTNETTKHVIAMTICFFNTNPLLSTVIPVCCLKIDYETGLV